MRRYVASAAALLLAFSPAFAEGLRGQYVEARTCDVWVGACFANAEMNLTGKHAVLAWKVDRGEQDGVRLDGLSVVAVVEASDTLGLDQTGPAKAVLLVDEKATKEQRKALVAAAKKLGGTLTSNVVGVETAPINVAVGGCKEGGCAVVDAGVARVKTRCLDHEEDRVCGHEDNFYPPLTKGVEVQSAMLTDHIYTGKGFNKTWKDTQRRGAYIGTFSLSK